MRFKGKDLWTEPDDQCSTCDNLRKCPLADSLVQGVVVLLSPSIRVKECGLYEPIGSPILKIV